MKSKAIIAFVLQNYETVCILQLLACAKLTRIVGFGQHSVACQEQAFEYNPTKHCTKRKEPFLVTCRVRNATYKLQSRTYFTNCLLPEMKPTRSLHLAHDVYDVGVLQRGS